MFRRVTAPCRPMRTDTERYLLAQPQPCHCLSRPCPPEQPISVLPGISCLCVQGRLITERLRYFDSEESAERFVAVFTTHVHARPGEYALLLHAGGAVGRGLHIDAVLAALPLLGRSIRVFGLVPPAWHPVLLDRVRALTQGFQRAGVPTAVDPVFWRLKRRLLRQYG